jgi:multidrug efflux system membrane fusion protein
MVSTVLIRLLVVRRVNANPRADDAEVSANFIGMTPLVNGPVTHLYVSDNKQVKAGDSLFEIDERPYAYALARADSDQHAPVGTHLPCNCSALSRSNALQSTNMKRTA